MRTSLAQALGFAVVANLVACASGETDMMSGAATSSGDSSSSGFGAGGAESVSSSSSSSSSSSGTGAGSSSSSVSSGSGIANCDAPCTSHPECQQACPAPSLGIYCCDPSGKCYNSSQMVCPDGSGSSSSGSGGLY